MLLFSLIMLSVFYTGSPAQFPGQPDRADLTFEQTPLSQAITRISQLYKVDILYADNVLQDKTITTQLEDKTIEQALSAVLEGTDVSFKTEGASQMVLFKRKPQKRDIYGWVVDAETGETLPYANVYIAGTSIGTASNKEGRFRLSGVPPQNTILNAEYMGYAEKRITLDGHNVTPNLFIELYPRELQTESVTVEDNTWQIFEYDRSGKGMGFARQWVEQLPGFSGTDAVRALHFVPGVQQNSNASTALSIRGGRPSENAVILDGINLYHTDHAFGIFSSVPSAVVKDIRLHKSAFPARYGGRTSAIVEMTGKTGNFEQPRFQLESNQMAALGVAEIPIRSIGNLIISGRHSLRTDLPERLFKRMNESPPFINDFIQTEGEGQQTVPADPDIRFYDAYGKLSLMPGKNDLVCVTFFKSQDRLENRGPVLSGLSSREWGWNTEGLSASWYRSWNRFWQTKWIASVSDYGVEQDSQSLRLYSDTPAQGTRLNNTLNNKKIGFDAEYTGMEKHHLQFGYEFKQVQTDFNEYHPEYADLLQHGIRSKTHAFYIQDDWNLTSRTRINSALRATYFDLADRYFMSPRLALTYALSDSLTLKGSYGYYHQFVSSFGHAFPNYIGQLTWLVNDNTVLKPANARHLVGGLIWQTPLADMDLTVYHKDPNGLIEQLNRVDAEEERPILPALVQRQSRSLGIDLTLKKSFRGLHTWLGYGFNDSRIEAGNDISYPIAGNAKHNIKAAGHFYMRRWAFSASWQWESGKPYSTPEVTAHANQFILTAPLKRNQERLAPTHRLDISLYYVVEQPLYQARLGLSFHNVFDSKNTWYNSFYIENGSLKSKQIYQIGFTPAVFLRLTI